MTPTHQPIPKFFPKKKGADMPPPPVPVGASSLPASVPIGPIKTPPPKGPVPAPSSVPDKFRAVTLPVGSHTMPNLTERAVLIKLNYRTFGNSRKVSSERVQVVQYTAEHGASVDTIMDKTLLRVTKQLLDSPELKAVENFDYQIDKFVQGLCLPYEIGIHLLPVTVLEMVESKLKALAIERKAMVDKFLATYESQCKAASAALNSVFNAGDYPPRAEVEKRFAFFWTYMALGAPDQLKGVSEEIWQEEKQKTQIKMQEACSEIQGVLRETMCKLVEHMADSLKPDEDTGKKKIFKDTTVSKLVEFMSNFNFRNVTDDVQLQSVVEQARSMMQGIEIKDLRNNDAVRSNMAFGMTQIAKALDGMLITSGRRKLNLD